MAKPINITSDMNPQEVLINAHEAVAMPALIMLFIGVLLIFAIIPPVLISNGIKNYKSIFFISLLISVIWLIFLILSPNTVQAVSGWFSGVF